MKTNTLLFECRDYREIIVLDPNNECDAHMIKKIQSGAFNHAQFDNNPYSQLWDMPLKEDNKP